MIKINDYVFQLENEAIEYVKDQVYHESFTYYSDNEIKEFQEDAVNSRICDLSEILDVDELLKMNEKIKNEKVENKMTKTQNYFTIKEAVETIIEAIKEERTEHIEDLHHVTFNEDYYIIGTHTAKEALEQYGVFDAIEEIQQYEKDNFGEILTDLSEPEKVANMLWYIVGENVLLDVNHYDYDLTDKEDQGSLIEALKEYALKFE